MNKSLALLLFLTIIVPQIARSENWPSVPILVVEGEASVDVPPEDATVEFHVLAFAEQSEAALAVVQQQVSRAIEVLQAFDVPADAITAFALQKDVERERRDRHELEILGYYVSRQIAVELSDLSRFSELVAALAQLDNVSTMDANFDVTNRDDVEAELMREAAEDARRKAENMATAMGVSVGDVRAISERGFRSGGALYSMVPRAYASIAADRAYRDTVFLPATITIRQSLHAVFDIEQ